MFVSLVSQSVSTATENAETILAVLCKYFCGVRAYETRDKHIYLTPFSNEKSEIHTNALSQKRYTRLKMLSTAHKSIFFTSQYS